MSAAPSAACRCDVSASQKVLSERLSYAFDFVNLLQQVTRAGMPAAIYRGARALGTPPQAGRVRVHAATVRVHAATVRMHAVPVHVHTVPVRVHAVLAYS